MRHNFSSKLPDTGTTIFAVMSKMAEEYNAINLSQGFPDFDVSEKLITSVHESMEEGYNQYAPMPGLPGLRRKLADHISDVFGLSTDPDEEITITTGATEGLYAAFTAIVWPGDEVIIFDPAYDSYDPAIRLNGGTPVRIPLNPPDYRIDWEEVNRKISKRTRAIVVNTPHNPTGMIFSEKDVKTLEQLAEEYDLFVISDEVYDKIIFNGAVHQGVLCSANLAARSFAIFSFGKTFHVTGWKVGYVRSPARLTQELRKAHQFITFSVNTPVQAGIMKLLENSGVMSGLGQFFESKRDLFLAGIKNSGFTPLPCHGTYFQLVSYEGMSNLNESDMAIQLTKEHGVAAIPVAPFYQENHDNKLLRFCFAKKEATLKAAAEKLCRI